ncbi:MAG TPA: peptide deformylase, partial [Rhabdochlamydiaceae bacterium]|nr:peptide deformylase [Rhabdochlamydiaceae bacterium]
MKLTFCYYGNPILRKKGEPVTEITEEIKQLAHAMVDYFDNNNGIGMAAQQVGKALKLFVVRRYIHLPDGKWTVSEPHVYINPKILEVSKETWV